jgi:manganese/zinc/iron transport system permease protein
MTPSGEFGILDEIVVFDLPVLLAAMLALVACGTLGNWLVLRKESMSGDAIAHSVLPGIVAGFLVTGRHSLVALFIGASVAGAAAILLSNWVRRRTRLDAGASLGIVFTAFFAIGVAMLEVGGARQVDLDPNCVLFGSLETMFAAPSQGASWLSGLPAETWVLLAAAATSVAMTIVFWKELAALSFDAGHARVSGVAPPLLEPAVLFATSLAIVASFEAVGSVLVIALLACPSLIAAPHARSLRSRFVIGLGVAAVLASAGYICAAHAPRIIGTETSLNAAGMIASFVAAGVPASFALRALISRRPA